MNKSPEPDDLRGKFYQICKEKLTAILLKIFQKKFAEEGTHPSSFYEAMITPVPKPNIPHKKRKLQANNTDEHRYKNPQQKTSKPNPKIY